jgi:hypothetical protein
MARSVNQIKAQFEETNLGLRPQKLQEGLAKLAVVNAVIRGGGRGFVSARARALIGPN